MKIIFNDKPAEVGCTALLDVLSELGIIKNAEPGCFLYDGRRKL